MQPKAVLLDGPGFKRTLRRLAHQMVESVDDLDALTLIGIRTRGVPLARRLQAMIQEVEGVLVPVGELDITLYRDDVLSGLQVPEVRPTVLPFDLDQKRVVLVDDVLYTGRTVRSALDALVDWGRPSWVRLAVMVDRGHSELPIQADYCGLQLETGSHDSIEVKLIETDQQDEVLLWTPKSEVIT